MARKNKPVEKIDDSLSNDAHLGTPSIYLTEFTKKKSADRRGSVARRAAHFVAASSVIFIAVFTVLLLAFSYTGIQTVRELRAQVEETYNPSFRVRFDDVGEQTIRARVATCLLRSISLRQSTGQAVPQTRGTSLIRSLRRRQMKSRSKGRRLLLATARIRRRIERPRSGSVRHRGRRGCQH